MRRLITTITALLLAAVTAQAQGVRVTPGGYVDGTGTARGGIKIPDFLQLVTVNTSAPAAGDCDAASETGRQFFDSTNDKVYYCSGTSGWIVFGTSGSFAPVSASFITQTAEGGLSGEQSLGLLSTGLMLNTVTAGTGVVSTFAPSAACTSGQFVTTLGASGTTTCAAPIFDVSLRVGTATTYDGIIIAPAVKGANQFDLTLSSADLTAARAINFPNAAGTVALTADKLSAFAATTSAEFFGVITNETGAGVVMGNANPAFNGVMQGESPAKIKFWMATAGSLAVTPGTGGTDLADGVYTITVLPLDRAGNEGAYPTAVTCTVNNAPATDGRCAVTWSAVTGAASYRVYTSLAGNATPSRYFAASTNSYNLDTLTGATVQALPVANGAYVVALDSTGASWFDGGTFTLGTPLAATSGGTGFASFTVGDMFYANSTSTVAKIPAATGTGLRFLSQSSTTTTPTWQTVPAQGNYTYYAIVTASDIGGAYQVQTSATPATAIQYVEQAFTNTTPVLMGTFATLSGVPNLTTIPAGIWRLHADAVKVSGTKTLKFYAEVYKRTTVPVETLLFTTQDSQFITTSTTANPEEIDLEYAHTAVTLGLTDRIVVKWYAVQGASGGNVTGRFYYDGNTLTRVEFPSQTISADNFVPYTGATAAVDLGAYSFTAKGLTTGNGNTTAGAVLFKEDTDNGANAVTLKGPDSTGDVTQTLQSVAGTVQLVPTMLSKSGAWTAVVTDGAYQVIVASANTWQLDLYAASGHAGWIVVVKNAGTGIITIDANSDERIDGATTKVLSVQNTSVTLVCDGSNWFII